MSGWESTELEPLEGGFSGETFVARSPDGDVVVRTYARTPDRVGVDAALLRLLRGLLPVPEVLETRLPEEGRPGLLVTERLPGVPLDRLVDEADAASVDWTALGRSLGAALATLSGIPQLRAGSFDGPDLQIGSRLPDDLVAWAGEQRETGRISTWSEPDWRGLRDVVDQGEELLAADPSPRAVLVHSDFNLKNLLVDPATWQLTGVLDWEYAHAGSPDADLGNLTRFEREPAFVEALTATLDARAPAAAGDRLARARAADLWAVVELAGRAQANTVSRLAESLLLAQARERDLHAWPFAGRRASVHAARVGSERGKPLS